MDQSALHHEFMRVNQRFRKLRTLELFHDMPRGEFIMLDVLHNNTETHREGMYVSELASRMHVLPPAASRTLKSLEAKGYIERIVSPGDRRNTLIRLTESGDAARRQKKEEMHQFMHRITKIMGEADMAELLRLWNKLIDIMEQESKNTDEREPEC